MDIFVQTVLFLFLVVFIANTILGIIVIKGNYKSKINKLFAVYAFSLAMWNISLFFTITGLGGSILQLWWSRLAFSFYLLMINSFFYFSIIYPGYKINKKMFIFDLIYWPLTAIIFGITLSPLLAKGNIKIINGFITGELGPLMQPLALYYVTFIILSLIILLYKLNKLKNTTRIRMSYVIIGFSIFAIPMILTQMVLPIFFNNFSYNNQGPLFSFPMLAVISYAIIRHRLFDIEVVIRRGIIFSSIFTIIAVSLVGFLSYLTEVLPKSIAIILISLIITIGFNPLKTFLENLTDKFLFKKRYKFEKIISEISELLITETDLDKMPKKIIKKIKDTLKVKKAAIALLENEGSYIFVEQVIGGKINRSSIDKDSKIINYLEREKTIIVADEIEYMIKHQEFGENKSRLMKKILNEVRKINFQIIAPIFSKEKLIALLFIGEKKSNDPFYDMDIKMVEFLDNEIAYPIENASIIKKLRHLDKAKTEFIDVVSHHLRTPITVSLWSLETTLSDGIKKIKYKQLENNLKNVYNILQKLNLDLDNLLIAMEIIENKLVTQKIEQNCYENVIFPVIEDYKKKYKEKNLKIEIFQDKKDYKIKCDPQKISYILKILLNNAMHYSPKNSTVKIFIERNEKEIFFKIKDEGIGVPAKYKDLIFEKFFRGEDVKKIRPDGLGVSLFIAKAFATAHNGELWCKENKKGEIGAEFILSLPTK